MSENNNFTSKISNSYLKKINNIILFFLAISISITLWFFYFIKPPTNLTFENQEIKINIERGQSTRKTASILKENNLIKSENFFNIIIAIRNKKIISGDYIFNRPENLLSIVQRLDTGEYRMPVVRITFFEGITVNQIAQEIKNKIPDFDYQNFLNLAKDKEGYLFPDTYDFKINTTAENILDVFNKNFERKIGENQNIINNSKYSLEEIIIMASIIEKEATAETFQEVSDILWHRIEIGMPLQVDAPFVYYIGKSTFDLTMSDLEDNHPYNTYRNTGLIPTPIGNPGIKSILAAANPRKTKNLFFLTGRDGKMYFATDLDGHRRNRFLYLD